MTEHDPAPLLHRLKNVFGWTRSSYCLLSVFLATIAVIGVVWWPLLVAELTSIDWDRPLWRQMDWLLLGNFVVMSVLIMAGADLKRDLLMIFIGLAGGLVIEGWGTQTRLWDYYTMERPPLWIIPAWPIASLSINRLVRMFDILSDHLADGLFKVVYWPIFGVFYTLMLVFVWPAADKSLTVMALLLSAFLILTPTDHRLAVLNFLAGAGLGYFLELWGTTRYCWIYYTRQTPPFFAVLAHGMANVAFWRVNHLVTLFLKKWKSRHGLVPQG